MHEASPDPDLSSCFAVLESCLVELRFRERGEEVREELYYYKYFGIIFYMHSPEAPNNNYEELRALFSGLLRKIELGLSDPRMTGFFKEIKARYSYEQYGHCILWHLIICSTPDQTDINFDTPGGEIEDFIRNKLPALIQK